MNDHAAGGREDPSVHEAAGQPDAEHTADPNSAPEATVSESQEIDALRAELTQANENYLRLAAELDNVRKRSQREIENAHRYGIERFAQSLLPVLDSFEAGLNVEHPDLETLLEGQRATLRLLQQAFTDAGIEPIDPVGEPFDPQQHEAMSLLSAPAAEPDSVIDVIQKGYALQARLLRPARVIVAKSPDG